MANRQLQIVDFHPKTQIIIRTWNDVSGQQRPAGTGGQEYILAGPGDDQFVGWSTQKTTTSQGEFTITLTAIRDKNGLSWAEKIRPMDYVEILASADGTTPEVIMRGFVDSSQESFAFQSTEGGPTRSVIIAGTDFTKLYMMFQIQYIWQTNPTAAVLAQYPYLSFALDKFFGTDLLSKKGGSLSYLIGELDKKVLGAFLRTFVKNFSAEIPTPVSKVFMPNEALVTPTYIENFTGAIWDIYTYFQSPPWGEMFVYDEPGTTSPILLFRVPPWHDINGVNPAPPFYNQFSLLPRRTIPSVEINTFTVGRADSQVVNFYFAEGDTSSTQTLQYPVFITPGAGVSVFADVVGQTRAGTVVGTGTKSALKPANPMFDLASVGLYGFRTLVEQSPWFSGLIANIRHNKKGTQAKQNEATIKYIQKFASEMTDWLYHVNKDNAQFMSGSISCHGRPGYVVGTYIDVDEVGHEGRQEFYVNSVEHSYTNFQTWTTTLGVERGRQIN